MKDLHFLAVRLANHSDVRVRVWVRRLLMLSKISCSRPAWTARQRAMYRRHFSSYRYSSVTEDSITQVEAIPLLLPSRSQAANNKYTLVEQVQQALENVWLLGLSEGTNATCGNKAFTRDAWPKHPLPSRDRHAQSICFQGCVRSAGLSPIEVP